MSDCKLKWQASIAKSHKSAKHACIQTASEIKIELMRNTFTVYQPIPMLNIYFHINSAFIALNKTENQNGMPIRIPFLCTTHTYRFLNCQRWIQISIEYMLCVCVKSPNTVGICFSDFRVWSQQTNTKANQ